ncbi:MAG: hypothetical protein ACRETQ_03590 [Gammaproteobacteria bacterium]
MAALSGNVPPVLQRAVLVNVRVQATNASVSSQYATTWFMSQPCIAPEVTGTGA